MLTLILMLSAGTALPALAEDSTLSDSVMGGITAEGITAGGDVSLSCSTSAASICVGTYDWNDNHQFDASIDKGAIVMDGNVQQNVSGEINMNQTQSAGANGANVIGNLSLSNTTLNITNSNTSTNFVGGF